jgi:CMP/dCMP kinase
MIIAIDGPAASGKSSTAALIAQKLGWCHINSGLLYRALAYALLNVKNYTSDTLTSATYADIDYCTDPKRFHCACQHSKTVIHFDNLIISPLLKTPEISEAASIISTNPYARECLTQLQRAMAARTNCIVDGRDAGSVVFPDADLKFYLTASVAERAHRLVRDQDAVGNKISLEQAQQIIQERDQRDATRKVAPLVIPHGAIVIDNSDLTQAQTVELMLEKINLI